MSNETVGRGRAGHVIVLNHTLLRNVRRTHILKVVACAETCDDIRWTAGMFLRGRPAQVGKYQYSGNSEGRVASERDTGESSDQDLRRFDARFEGREQAGKVGGIGLDAARGRASSQPANRRSQYRRAKSHDFDRMREPALEWLDPVSRKTAGVERVVDEAVPSHRLRRQARSSFGVGEAR